VSTQLQDALYRAIRTFFQAWSGILLAQAGMLLTDLDDGEISWALWKRVMLSGVASGVIAVVTFLHNFFEDHKIMPTFLKPTDRTVGDAAMGETP
jgi:hypothetical protein